MSGGRRGGGFSESSVFNAITGTSMDRACVLHQDHMFRSSAQPKSLTFYYTPRTMYTIDVIDRVRARYRDTNTDKITVKYEGKCVINTIDIYV
jgi:hypothetical protein